MIRQITKRQFDAYCYVRQPLVRVMAHEIAWFEAGEKKLLAAIIYDRTDRDFGHVILGRDKRNLFRCIHVSTKFFTTPDAAVRNLRKEIKPYLNDRKKFYPQGDEFEAPNKIFKAVAPAKQQHPYFKTLNKEPRFEAARNLIKEIAYSFVDVDGNYIQQFQTSGFDARLWELYLYVYFYNSGFEINKKHQFPDYCLNKLGYECFVEAVTVGASPNFDEPNAVTPKDIIELSKDYVPIKFGSALFTKINRKNKYWNLAHVKGHPFILAIHDYHGAANGKSPGSMTWTRAGLSNYLYGIRDEVEFDKDGRIRPVLLAPCVNPTVKTVRTKTHTYKHKTIPSNFFEQPESENVSAVIFSNAATITTFNRMGKLAGLGSKDIKMIRQGMKVNMTPGAFIPEYFAQDVDDPDYEEAWSDGITMYHNPNALHPIIPEAFPDISHVIFDKESNSFESLTNKNQIFSSVTFVVEPKGKKIKTAKKKKSKAKKKRKR